MKAFIILLGLTFLKGFLNELDESFYSGWVAKYREVSGNQEPPSNYKKWIRLASELEVTDDPADYKQIFEDLKPYKSMGLTVKNMADLASKIRRYGVKVTGNERATFMRSRSMWPFRNSLSYLPQVLDPNINFYTITHVYDEGIVAPADDDQERRYVDISDLFRRSKVMRKAHEGFSEGSILLRAPNSFVAVPFDVPVFSANRLRGFKDILLPSFRTGIPAYRYNFKTALNAPNWEDKEKRAMFRGRTTGINFRKVRRENIPLNSSPRIKLHEMSMQQKQGKLHSTVPGITEIHQCKENQAYINALKAEYPLAPSLNYSQQFKSKYLVVVDGNGWPDRVAFFMLSGSLVFLSTLHEEWVINQLVDGEHYIKVKPDLSDLIEKLEWAAENDAEAKRIASNGREFAQKRFGIRQMQIYNSFLFMEYQRLFQ